MLRWLKKLKRYVSPQHAPSGWSSDDHALGFSGLPLSVQPLDTGNLETWGLAPSADTAGV